MAGVFAFFRRFCGVGDQDGLEIEFRVILVSMWLEFWVVLLALWCNSYSGSLKEFRIRPLYRWCFRVFSTIFEVGDQNGLEIEFWVVLVPLWTEFWVVLLALCCTSYSCGAFKSGKRIKNTYWEEPHRWKKRGCSVSPRSASGGV